MTFIPDIEVDKELKRKAALLPLTMDQIKEALSNNRGNIYYAAKELGVSRALLNRRIKNNLALKKHMEDLEQEFLDITEAELVKQVEMGNMTAISLVLRTKGKDRGYTERATIEHELGENAMRSSAALIEAMRRGLDDSKVVDVEDYKWVEPEQLVDKQDQTS